MNHPVSAALLISTAALVLAACGGGSNSGGVASGPSGQAPEPSDLTWTAGQFEDSAVYKSRCVVPQPGTSDVSGSALTEKFWLRSWSDETYLWYNEITDQDPASIADVQDYFDVLKTEATTASGAPKDQFHFDIPTDEYEARRNGTASAGYGASFALLASSRPRDIRVAYTQDNGPAGRPNGFRRGDKILVVDGLDAVNDFDTEDEVAALNEAIFPTVVGETHVFEVRGADGEIRTVTLNTEAVVEQPVTETEVIDTDIGKVGYIHFTTFSPLTSEKAIVDAMRTVSNAGATELVLDLRYNGGGLLAVAAQTGYMVAGPNRTSGRTFDRLTFNDKNPTTNPVTGRALSPTPFYSTGLDFSVSESTALPALNLNRVFILTTDGTCSASEAVINGLRGADVEVVLIGTGTCGKPYGFYPTDNCGTTYFTVQFRGANDKGFGDYADGFEPEGGPGGFGVVTPGCTIADDFSEALGDPEEALFAAALQYAEDGTCPVEEVAKTDPSLDSERFFNTPADMRDDPRLKQREFLRNSRIEER